MQMNFHVRERAFLFLKPKKRQVFGDVFWVPMVAQLKIFTKRKGEKAKLRVHKVAAAADAVRLIFLTWGSNWFHQHTKFVVSPCGEIVNSSKYRNLSKNISCLAQSKDYKMFHCVLKKSTRALVSSFSFSYGFISFNFLIKSVHLESLKASTEARKCLLSIHIA